MGSRLVAFPVGADQTLLVEVDDPNVGNQPISRGVAERARDTFETAIAQIKPGVEALMAQLRDLSAKPENISLEFGIKFTAGRTDREGVRQACRPRRAVLRRSQPALRLPHQRG